VLINLDIFYLLFIFLIRFVVFVYRLVNKVDHIFIRSNQLQYTLPPHSRYWDNDCSSVLQYVLPSNGRNPLPLCPRVKQ